MQNHKNRILYISLFIATCFVLVSCKKDESSSEPDAVNKNEWVKISDEGMSMCNTIAISGTEIYVGTMLNGAYYSGDNGTSWQSINTGLPGQVDIKTIYFSGSYLLTATDKGVYRTSNKGTEWYSANSGLPDKCEINDIAKLNQKLYVATSKGVFSSSDNGTNWTSVNNTALIDIDIDSYQTYHRIDKLAIQGSNIFAYGLLAGICRSSNYGESWKKINKDLFISALTVSEKYIYASAILGVYRSSDNGENWTLANKGKELSITNAFAVSGSDIYAAGSDIYKTSDNGTNWTPFNTGLENAYMEISGLTISGNFLYAATTNGVWRCKFQ